MYDTFERAVLRFAPLETLTEFGPYTTQDMLQVLVSTNRADILQRWRDTRPHVFNQLTLTRIDHGINDEVFDWWLTNYPAFIDLNHRAIFARVFPNSAARWEWFPLKKWATARPQQVEQYLTEARQTVVITMLTNEAPPNWNVWWIIRNYPSFRSIFTGDVGERMNPMAIGRVVTCFDHIRWLHSWFPQACAHVVSTKHILNNKTPVYQLDWFQQHVPHILTTRVRELIPTYTTNSIDQPYVIWWAYWAVKTNRRRRAIYEHVSQQMPIRLWWINLTEPTLNTRYGRWMYHRTLTLLDEAVDSVFKRMNNDSYI